MARDDSTVSMYTTSRALKGRPTEVQNDLAEPIARPKDEERDQLQAHLQQLGVQCGIHYPTTLNRLAPFAGTRSVPDGAPRATEFSGKILSLPIFPEITEQQINHVVDSIRVFGDGSKKAKVL